MLRVGVMDVPDRSFTLLQVCFLCVYACERGDRKREGGEPESYCKSLGYTAGAKMIQ